METVHAAIHPLIGFSPLHCEAKARAEAQARARADARKLGLRLGLA
jgi:hypothetical protein